VTRHVTVRSPLAILTTLSNTALVALLVVGFWLYVWSRATGGDWLLVFVLPAIAVLLLLLTLLQRFTVAPDGIVVTNLVARRRFSWSEVAAVEVSHLHGNILLTFGFSAPGVVVWKEGGGPLNAYATWGLREGTRRRLAAAIAAAAVEHRFRNGVTAEALALRADEEGESEPDDAGPSRWDEHEVECAFCGRRGSVEEMQRLDAGEGAWHCADPYGCSRDQVID
jgi:hypothetical protein